MAQSLASWIAKSIIQHDREHGADFHTPWTGSSKCGQLVKFTTYRTAENPHAAVRGVISDRTHTVGIEFDATATDAFETSVAGEPAESLTSCLRAVIRLKAFAFRVHPPPTGSDVAKVSLHASAWEVVSGDRSDPVFYSQAVDVCQDERVDSVLRKWWFGVSSSASDPTPERKPQMVRRVSREGSRQLSSAWSTTNDTASTGGAGEPVRSLRDFLHRFDAGAAKQKAAKGPKGLPNVLFDPPSPGQMAQLEAITIFGVEIGPVDVGEDDEEEHYVPDYGFTDESDDEGGPSRATELEEPQDIDRQLPARTRARDSINAPTMDTEEEEEEEEEDEAAATAYYAAEDRFEEEEDDDIVQGDDVVEEPEPRHSAQPAGLLATPSAANPRPVSKHRTPLLLSSDDDDEIVIRRDPTQRRKQVRRRPRGESSFHTPQRDVAGAEGQEVVAESAGEEYGAGGSDDELSDYERQRRRGDTELDRPTGSAEADDPIVVEDQGADDGGTGNDEIDADEPEPLGTEESDADEPVGANNDPAGTGHTDEPPQPSAGATRQLTSTQSREHADEIDSSLSQGPSSQPVDLNHTASSPPRAASPRYHDSVVDRTPVQVPKRRRDAEASTVSNDSAASTSTSRSTKRLRQSPAQSTAPPAEQRTPATPPTSVFSRMNPMTWLFRRSKTSQESAASKEDDHEAVAEPADAADKEDPTVFTKATPSSPSPPLKDDSAAPDAAVAPSVSRRQKFNGELSRDLVPLFRVKGLTAAQTKKLLAKGIDARAKQRTSLAPRQSDTQRRV